MTALEPKPANEVSERAPRRGVRKLTGAFKELAIIIVDNERLDDPRLEKIKS